MGPFIGMCLLLNCKIVHCKLHVFSFSFVHTPVCANCKNDSCNIYSKKKKGRESLRPQTLHKKLSKSVLSALPPACKSF